MFTIQPADYAICGVTTAISLGIGMYHAVAKGGQKSTAKYLVGNRNMGILPVSFSLVATYMSSVFALGHPAEAYVYGVPKVLGFSLVIVVSCALMAWITVPLLHPLNITSSYEVNIYIVPFGKLSVRTGTFKIK